METSVTLERIIKVPPVVSRLSRKNIVCVQSLSSNSIRYIFNIAISVNNL